MGLCGVLTLRSSWGRVSHKPSSVSLENTQAHNRQEAGWGTFSCRSEVPVARQEGSVQNDSTHGTRDAICGDVRILYF